MDQGFEGTTTLDLIRGAQTGDQAATGHLLARYRPMTFRFITGRLPYPRDLKGTEELVQDTLLKVVRRLPTLSLPTPHHLVGYLHRASRNAVISESRHLARLTRMQELTEQIPDLANSPLGRIELRECLERYDRCRAKLNEKNRVLIAAVFEAGCDLENIRLLFGYPSRGAAHVAVHRAIKQMEACIGRDRG